MKQEDVMSNLHRQEDSGIMTIPVNPNNQILNSVRAVGETSKSDLKTLVATLLGALRTSRRGVSVSVMECCISAILLASESALAQVPPGCVPSPNATQFADVTGDGKADAIAINTNGITVRPSNGTDFLPKETWSSVPYYGGIGTYFADVTGDGKADAIVVNTNGIVVRPSDGNEFLPNEVWSSYPYYGSLGTYFADVTGDGKADAIVVNPSGIVVRPSDGHEFLPNQIWSSNPYYGSMGTYFADVTGDGKSDAIVVNNTGITVRRSDGHEFLANELWLGTQGGYLPSAGCWTDFSDVNGDGRADAVFICSWGVEVSLSTGNLFLPPVAYTSNPYYGSVGTYFADLTGDGRADAIVVNTNNIVARLSSGSAFGPNQFWTTNPYYGNVFPTCLQ
jgi:hypothetical protein